MSEANGTAHIVVTGVNHHSASIEVREKLSLTRAQVPEALNTLNATYGRGVIVATCSRTEIYTITEHNIPMPQALSRFLASQFNVSIADTEQYLFTLHQKEAVSHLFRVASGLDSLILGESEVLGQVREAYSLATNHNSAGGVLTKLFHAALRVGKRARNETLIGKNAMSVSRASVETGRRLLGDLVNRQGLVVGVGETSRLAAHALRDAGIGKLTVVNRTQQHAEELARDIDATVAPLTRLPELLQETDIVITSTAAPEYVIDANLINSIMPMREGRAIFLMDLAVPRDVDPDVVSINNVHLYDLDHLEAVAEANRKERKMEALKVESIVEQEVHKFIDWWVAQKATPTIAAMRARAEQIRTAEFTRTIKNLTHLSEKDLGRVEVLSKSLVKKLLDAPTRSLRDRRDENHIQAARMLFDIEEERPGKM